MLVSAFFEWKDEGGKKKQPYYIHRADGKRLAFAGLWDPNTQATPCQTLESCAIITTSANGFVSKIHDRMPVVLDETHWEYWLDPISMGVEGLLVPWAGEMAAHRVTHRMNDARYRERDAVEAVGWTPIRVRS